MTLATNLDLYLSFIPQATSLPNTTFFHHKTPHTLTNSPPHLPSTPPITTKKAPITLYDITADLFTKALESLRTILQKAKSHDPSNADSFVSARLYEDMLPLSFQIQVVSNTAKKTFERLLPSKGPYPVFPDDEKTLDELIARVEATLEIVRRITPEDLAGVDDKAVQFGIGPGMPDAESTGGRYVLGYSIPNLMFHLTTAYAILRAQGVPLGKRDYIATFMLGAVPDMEERVRKAREAKEKGQ